MTADPRELRRQSAMLRRAADRLTLLRLRLANTIAEVSRSRDPDTGRLARQVHEHFSDHEYPELGRVAAGMRAMARSLEEAATSRERAGGRRLGGYGGAGFLGRGNDAHQHVGEVARFVGTQHGASIGGFPLVPNSEGGFLPHVSHSLGTDTPDYDEGE